jgi:hypothetical protein
VLVSSSSSTSHKNSLAQAQLKFVSPFPQALRPVQSPRPEFKEKQEKLPPAKPDLVLFMNEILEHLSEIRDLSPDSTGNEGGARRVRVYRQLEILMENCEKVELGFDVLVTNKFAKYINLACILMLAIGDKDCLIYGSVLAKLHRLNKFCKSRVMSFVRFRTFFIRFGEDPKSPNLNFNFFFKLEFKDFKKLVDLISLEF